jgi:MFS family permease
MGVYQSAGSLARVLGPPVAGWVFDVLGIQFPFLVAAVLSLLACAGALVWRGGTAAELVTDL